MFSVLSGCASFAWENVWFLLEKCLEIGVLTAFSMMPVLALATSKKGYILPVSFTLIYIFFGFFIISVNMYLHPISSMAVIVMRNKEIEGIMFSMPISVPYAVLCIGIWDIAAIIFANISLKKR